MTPYDEHDSESVTRRIDEAVAALSGRDEAADDAVAVGRRVLDAPEW